MDLCIGLMSGTSLDGVDGVILKTDGFSSQPVLMDTAYEPYDEELRNQVLILCQQQRNMTGTTIDFLSIERDITKIHAKVVHTLLAKANLSPMDISVIGFHGQTIVHRPQERITWQLGNGALLSELTQITVVNNFRSRDVASGGQGAPLLPIYHAILSKQLQNKLQTPNPVKSICILNIGGVSNTTYITFNQEQDPSILAFDMGPGNALLNDWVLRHKGVPFDKNGDISRQGKPIKEYIQKWIQENSYFSKLPPKSLDRNEFCDTLEQLENISIEDGAATLIDFTVESIKKGCDFLNPKPEWWFVCGGGRHNQYLMEQLQHTLAPAKVSSVDTLGWNGDMLEAEGMAFLAARCLKKLPLSFPSTTSCPSPKLGGSIHYYT